MRPIDTLLPRLTKVRAVGPAHWVACCPAHPDKHPSLRIRELPDGTLLIKCWVGCSAPAICAAVGLTLRDLFVTSRHRRRTRGPSLKALLHEGLICRIGTALLAQGIELSAEDQARLERAKQRLEITP